MLKRPFRPLSACSVAAKTSKLVRMVRLSCCHRSLETASRYLLTILCFSFWIRLVSNVSSFKLPDPAGRAGGALTSAMLNTTYADHHDTVKDLTFKEVLLAIRGKLDGKGFSQIPQLSSSRPTNLDEPFALVPEGSGGVKRAVMVGINYVGHNPGELRGCHNDVLNVRIYNLVAVSRSGRLFCVAHTSNHLLNFIDD